VLLRTKVSEDSRIENFGKGESKKKKIKKKETNLRVGVMLLLLLLVLRTGISSCLEIEQERQVE
jgi:hypothetical protein